MIFLASSSLTTGWFCGRHAGAPCGRRCGSSCPSSETLDHDALNVVARGAGLGHQHLVPHRRADRLKSFGGLVGPALSGMRLRPSRRASLRTGAPCVKRNLGLRALAYRDAHGRRCFGLGNPPPTTLECVLTDRADPWPQSGPWSWLMTMKVNRRSAFFSLTKAPVTGCPDALLTTPLHGASVIRREGRIGWRSTRSPPAIPAARFRSDVSEGSWVSPCACS